MPRDRCISERTTRDHRPCFELQKTWPDGQRFRRQYPTITLAKAMRARIENAIVIGTWRELKTELYEGPPHDPTIREFAEVYLAEYCRIRNSRPDFKQETLNDIVPIVGDVRLKAFARSDAVVFETERSKAVAGPTVNRGLSVLSHLLTFAAEKGLIPWNPMIGYGRIPEERRALRAMESEDERRLVDRTMQEDLAVGVYCGLMGETGMRPEEGLRLEWKSIDLRGRMLTVERSKTKKARHIPLSDFAMELLGVMPHVIGIPQVVVRLETRKAVRDGRGPFERAKRGTGLDWVTFRDFRHFRASQWVKRGVDLISVQELMGHADIHTTRRYAHFAPNHALRSIIEAQRGEAATLAQLSMFGRETEGKQ